MSVLTAEPRSNILTPWSSADYTTLINKAKNPTIPDITTYIFADANDDLEQVMFGATVPLASVVTTFVVNYYILGTTGTQLTVGLRVNNTEEAGQIHTCAGSKEWGSKTFNTVKTRNNMSQDLALSFTTPTMPKAAAIFIYRAYIDITGTRFYPVKT